MGYHFPEVSLFVAPVTFCLPTKGNKPEFVKPACTRAKMASRSRIRDPTLLPAGHPSSLDKEADALFFWLVLRLILILNHKCAKQSLGSAE